MIKAFSEVSSVSLTLRACSVLKFFKNWKFCCTGMLQQTSTFRRQKYLKFSAEFNELTFNF